MSRHEGRSSWGGCVCTVGEKKKGGTGKDLLRGQETGNFKEPRLVSSKRLQNGHTLFSPKTREASTALTRNGDRERERRKTGLGSLAEEEGKLREEGSKLRKRRNERKESKRVSSQFDLSVKTRVYLH